MVGDGALSRSIQEFPFARQCYGLEQWSSNDFGTQKFCGGKFFDINIKKRFEQISQKPSSSFELFSCYRASGGCSVMLKFNAYFVQLGEAGAKKHWLTSLGANNF